ncbi:MAG: ATP-binding cassette domain-containing protein, partial [Candidatus Paceibacterota bacterium]
SGSDGGKVVFQGSISEYKKSKTPTSEYVFSNKAEIVDHKRTPNLKALQMKGKLLKIKSINKNNLTNFDLALPLGQVVCLSGQVGTGKTTILELVYQTLFKGKNAWRLRKEAGGHYGPIEGKTFVRRSYFVDQTPLNKIKTSLPATYLGVWSKIQKLKPKNISHRELEKKTIDEALVIFKDNSIITRKLGFLKEVGLGYLTLGQKSGTLSGGEAQRVRLAKILSKKLGDRCVYILDTPSRGLHLSDLPTLNKVFQKIVDKNNTVLIADNREELIKNSDFNIKLENRYQALESLNRRICEISLTGDAQCAILLVD